LTRGALPASSRGEEDAMATEEKIGHKEGAERLQVEGGIGSPISNEAYNVIACLHEKLQGLEAMRKFSKDADQETWKRISQLDMQAVDILLGQLEQLVRDGKLRGEASAQGQRPTARS
jgi:hypothetical protein